jgi:hypothetical protein
MGHGEGRRWGVTLRQRTNFEGVGRKGCTHCDFSGALGKLDEASYVGGFEETMGGLCGVWIEVWVMMGGW